MILIGIGQWRSHICDFYMIVPLRPREFSKVFRLNFPLLNWLPAASCGGKIWLPTVSCSGELILNAASCSRKVFPRFSLLLPAAFCRGKIGKIWLPAAWCSSKIWLLTTFCSCKIWLPTAGSHTSSLQNAAGRFDFLYMTQRGDLNFCCIMQREDFCKNHQLDSPLHNAAERCDSLLHAAGSQTSIKITPRFWN